MSEDSKIKEFPDIGTKLTAPSKKSLFERQKAEAEAKRAREQQETAAVYEDFVKSFDDTDDALPSASNARGQGANSGFGGSSGGFAGLSKRHFSGPPSGPSGRGGLGSNRGISGPGSLGPPSSSLSRKRAYDGTPSIHREADQGLFAFEDSSTGPADAKTAFHNSDDEEEEKTSRTRAHERVTPKPTIHLSSIPPGTSQAVIKSILPSNLNIDAVRILPPQSGQSTTERRSLSAIVTLAKDTPAIDIDTAVSALQNKYLGWGFYLSLSRHLSSAAVGSGISASLGFPSNSSLPFGARPLQTGPGGGLSRAPPPGSHRGGFAPPSSYAPTGPGQYGRSIPPAQITVTPPADLKQLKLVHKTLEALLTHGPEFEALLMTRPDVQREERWAWLWDSRSVGGVWYRWRLWDILTGAQKRIQAGKTRNSASSQFIFDGGATWAAPERILPFEYVTEIQEFVSDSEYDSSEDEDSGDEGRRRLQHLQGGAPPPENILGVADNDIQAYLNPLQKAKLVHLLARLPTTNAKLRRGDVARITAFAIQHAGEGAEEVVDMITTNVQAPFSFTSANPDRKIDVEDQPPKDDDEVLEDEKRVADKEDSSSSKLIALYIISDILSSSSTSGVRHAWRYRQLFEATLRNKKIFERLGRLEKDMHWGRLRAEKWKRSVNSVLTLWEGWCVFPQAAQEHFAAMFLNPPLTAKEEAANKLAEKASAATLAAKSKWKTVEEKAKIKTENVKHPDHDANADMDVDGEPMVDDEEEDVDGQPMDDDDEDVDGQPMDDLEGEAMDDDDDDVPVPNKPSEDDESGGKTDDKGNLPKQGLIEGISRGTANQDGTPSAKPLQGGRRRRPKAEDMFADSDGE